MVIIVRRFLSIFLMLLYININTVKAIPPITSNILKQCVYEANAFIQALDGITTVQNISKDNSIYFVLLDEKGTVIQAIKMETNSAKYTLHTLEPNYKIIIVGKGSAFFS